MIPTSRTDVAALLRGAGVPRAEELASLALPCVVLTTRPAGRETRTRIGGLPDLAVDRQWPRSRYGSPLTFIGQIDLAVLAGTAVAGELRRRDCSDGSARCRSGHLISRSHSHPHARVSGPMTLPTKRPSCLDMRSRSRLLGLCPQVLTLHSSNHSGSRTRSTSSCPTSWVSAKRSHAEG